MRKKTVEDILTGMNSKFLPISKSGTKKTGRWYEQGLLLLNSYNGLGIAWPQNDNSGSGNNTYSILIYLSIDIS